MSQINETAIKTPGVYVNEIPSFPPSVAQVATAVPAFIGYTQMAIVKGKSVTNQAVRISSLVQYVQYFGSGPENLGANVYLDTDGSVSSVDITPTYQMFNAIRMFFNHGGINCYIISVGTYKSDGKASIDDFIKDGQTLCFEVLQKQDEPTLIVVPDAVMLGKNDYNNVMVTALNQCGALQDRFTIMDVRQGDQDRSYDSSDVISLFRDGVGTSNLSYGAAYYPWLRSSLQYTIHYEHMTFFKKGTTTPAINLSSIVSNTFLTKLDAALANKKTPVNPLSVVSVNFAGGVTAVADKPASGTVTLTKVVVDDIFTVKADGAAISTAFKATSTDMAATATAIAAAVTLSGYTATAAGAVITITAAAGTGATLNAKVVACDIAGGGGSTATTVNLAGGVTAVTEVLGTCNCTISQNVVGQYALLANTTPIAVYTSKDGDTTDIIAGNLAGTISGGYAATVAGSVISLTAAKGTGATVIALTGTITITDDILNNIEAQLTSSSAVFANIVSAIKDKGIIVPPSGAIAGVYASVDGSRGVWKAPANVSLNTVIEPMVSIDDNMQEDLNIDTNAGKSVNAIRYFTGKGILVWGSRTLAGNDNDWRYIPVRRLYIMVEESVKKATYQFVFEPNDGKTWTRVRAMIENYLTLLWRDGALAGSKPELAFYVKVGLGQTMTFQDILDGKMIIEIGMAPVRPAEFIILRFSQVQQQA